jgi:hypothetical protein
MASRRIAFVLVVAAIAAAVVASRATPADTVTKDAPRYSADGKLLRPDYRQWVFLSSGLGMNYNPATGGPDHPMFTNVYAAPEAYNSFLKTGTWPDKTILVLEVYGAATNGSINRAGHFQDKLMGVEAHVKDTWRKGDAWKFYPLEVAKPAAAALPDGNVCTQCHVKSGAVENTFVQFYPTLLEVAKRKGTLKPGTDIGK